VYGPPKSQTRQNLKRLLIKSFGEKKKISRERLKLRILIPNDEAEVFVWRLLLKYEKLGDWTHLEPVTKVEGENEVATTLETTDKNRREFGSTEIFETGFRIRIVTEGSTINNGLG